MKTTFQFFRLIRFSNMLVILITMCFFYALLSSHYPVHQNFDTLPTLTDKLGLNDTNFLLLMAAVILIAASGNIINDYFDQKADRVNKPERLIIGKYIKRRWAIILNWTFNGIAFLILLNLSYQLNNWWLVFIGFACINLLYFYSAIYKRKLIIGNIIVAGLTAIVPLYVFVYFAFSDFAYLSQHHTDRSVLMDSAVQIVIFYAGFAFLFNLIREIIKDMADVKGDLLLQSQTLPIRLGFSKTKWILSILYLFALAPLLFFAFTTSPSLSPDQSGIIYYFIYLILGVIISMGLSFIILLSKNQRKYYLRASNLIKLAMLFGVLSALFYS